MIFESQKIIKTLIFKLIKKRVKLQKDKPNKGLNPYLKYTSIAIQMGATIFLGNLLGIWLDKKFSTTYLENIVTLLAVFMAMYFVISQVIKTSKEND